jgi:uncharacterized protein (TIRG00374 family)
MRHKFIGSPTFSLIIKLIVTIALFYILLTMIDLEAIKRIIPRTNFYLFSLATAVFFARNIFAAWRWQILLKAKGYDVSFGRLTRLYFIGYFFSFFLPTVMGGDIARGYYLYSGGVSKKEAVSSIMIERVLGLLALTLFAFSSVLFGFRLINSDLIKVIVIIPSILFLIILLFFYYSKIDLTANLPGGVIEKLNPLIRLIHNLKSYNKRPDILFSAFLMSLLFQFLGIISTYFIALSVQANTEFIYFLILLPIVWFVSLVPISLNGLGIREGIFVFLFVIIGMPKETAITISGLYLLQVIAQGLLGGLFFFWDQEKIASIKEYSNLPSKVSR